MSAESGKGIDEVIAKTEQITVATDVSKNFDAIEKPMGNNNDPAEDAAAAALETVDPESLEMEPFNCTICGMSELCYFFSDGYLPLGISPGSFCILDPFDQFEKNADFTNPSSFDDVIVLGSLCSICGSSVCVDSSCSVYFEQTFCRECALYEPNKEMFPPEVLKGMEESIKKREESRKKHEAESKKPELAATIAHDSVINLGTKFVFAFTNSHINPNDTISTEKLTVTITNPNPQESQVTIDSKYEGWKGAITRTVPPKSSITVEIAPAAIQAGYGFQKRVGTVVEAKGISLEASAHVTVLAENQHADGGSSDTFTVFPVCNLGTQYKAVGDLAIANKTNLYTIVAAEDNTHVTFAHRQGTVTKKLQRLQTATFVSIDLPTTNNPISADKVVVVVSGAVCGFGYLKVSSICNEEALMLLPVGAWGSTYPFAPFFGQQKTEVIALPWQQDTVVSFGSEQETLQNDTYRVWKTEATVVEASKPVDMIAVGGTTSPDYLGAPFFTHVPAVEQFINGSLTLHTGIDVHSQSVPIHYVRIVQYLSDLDSVSINGWPVSGLIYRRIGRTNYFYVDYPVGKGKHTVTSEKKFGCLVYGYGEFVGYAYVPSLNLPSTATC